MNWLLLIAIAGSVITAYFLGRQHENVRLMDDRDQLIAHLAVLACTLGEKQHENARLRQVLMDKRELMMRPGSRN